MSRARFWKMKIACVQMDIAFGKPELNFSKIEKYIEEGAMAGADVIVFPEMWNTAYALKHLGKLAEKNGERTKQLLTSFAKKYNLNIVGG